MGKSTIENKSMNNELIQTRMWNLDLPVNKFVDLGKVLNFSEPQFPDLQNGDNIFCA